MIDNTIPVEYKIAMTKRQTHTVSQKHEARTGLLKY